ncbi:protein CANDIDATE G-PROTEIN COUPLED RECEPTOR 7-like [Nicotiana tomentosiformis]|uniref:protein CANDIDATE G-PROTEIN COUPLED RECEPTOR 7-like n=1 Tax=Nicotiana tomentosiformis TaxID=4098 RepID=UPI00051B0239|nr:protein CANDIDATE G-PROTEIN COUPLED RECEPTOR 7-like [Nicotiana tomentosiformis]
MEIFYHLTCLNLLQALFIISSFRFSVGEIKNTHIVDDSRQIILIERFGFSPDGHVTISLDHVSWRSNEPAAKLYPSSMGFCLVRDVSFPRLLNESMYTENFCVLSSKYVNLVFRFDKLGPDSTYNASTTIDEPDEYNLIFGNCQKEFLVTMNVHTEMYNVNNGEKDFLPAGQTPLPKFYFLCFIVYLAFLAIWGFICIKQRKIVHKLHLIMAMLLIFKALKLICASEDKMYIRNTGKPHGWDVAFYIFGFLKGVTLFTVIVLIGTGWSFLKPFLHYREKKVLMFVIPLQVIENIASIVISESGPVEKHWLVWNEVFLLIDVMCCCIVLVPILWSIKSLREASKNDGKAAEILRKLTLFRHFYVVLIVYLYFTRFGIAMIESVVNYINEWVTIVAAEGASLMFYMFIFYNFQPIEKNPYLAIDKDDDSEEEEEEEEDDEDDA